MQSPAAELVVDLFKFGVEHLLVIVRRVPEKEDERLPGKIGKASDLSVCVRKGYLREIDLRSILHPVRQVHLVEQRDGFLVQGCNIWRIRIKCLKGICKLTEVNPVCQFREQREVLVELPVKVPQVGEGIRVFHQMLDCRLLLVDIKSAQLHAKPLD